MIYLPNRRLHFKAAAANNKLLLHYDNNFIDSTYNSKIVTNNGVTFSNTIYKFGGYSAYFNGTSYLSLSDTSDWNFTNSDCTIDFWLNLTTLDFRNLIIGQSDGSDGNWQILTTSDGAIAVSLAAINNIGEDVTGVITSGAWYHVEVDRVNSTGMTYIFVNGILKASGNTNVWNDSSKPLYIGGAPSYRNITGYMDELSITKGIAKHTTNFTPPTQPY